MTMLEVVEPLLRPTTRRVLLKRMGGETMTEGGLLLPDTSIRPSQLAVVLEVGRDVEEDIPLNEVVVVPQFAGTEVQVGDEWYLLLPETEILARYGDGEPTPA